MKKRSIALLLGLTMAFFFGACSSGGVDTNQPVQEEFKEESTDQKPYQITLDEAVQRVNSFVAKR